MIKRIVKIFGLLAFSYLVFFAVIVYPNDSRVGFPDLEALKALRPELTEPTQLNGKWPDFTVSLSEADYKSAFERARKATPHYLGENFGIASPFLLNHSIGDYPDRIEGSQGINLPVGEWVEFSPDLAGTFQLEVKLTSIGGSPELEVFKNQTGVEKFQLKPPPAPSDISSLSYQYLFKYWSVDRQENAHPWLVKNTRIDVAVTDKIRFECKGTTGFCFLSRPIFFEKAASSKPNYLVILVDTLRQSAVTKEDSPVMDSLRQEGREYTETYAAGNLTSQSTNAFLTCQKPSDIGSLAFSYNMPPLSKEQFYKKAQPSFAHFFKRAGWKTTMIGNVSVISEVLGAGIDHGFEDQIAIEREAYDTGKIAGEAIRWLRDNGDKPFFLYLHFHATHAPYRPPLRDIFQAYRGLNDLSSMPNILRWLYRGEVNYTDRYVKQVLEALKRLGLAENTKIVLTADHGDQQQIHKFADNKTGYAETGAFFDHGATLLNDEIHIPLVFVGIDGFPKGSTDSNIASNLDIGPTLLDDAGIDIPTWCDGLSLVAAERSRLEMNRFDRVIGSEGIRQRAIYFGDRYKYTVSYSTTEKNLFRENSYNREMFGLLDQDILVDLKADRDETHNLCEEKPEILKTARKLFDEYFRTQYLWEVIFESPDGSEMSAQFDVRDAPIKFQGLDLIEENGHVVLNMLNNQRGIATFDHPLASLPKVTSGSAEIPILNTYAKLNLGTTDLGLPVENIGEEALLPVGSKKLAYLRKVAKTDFQARKIVAGNPQFEAILREWGYLNDN